MNAPDGPLIGRYLDPAESLGEIGPDAKSAVPALIESLKDPSLEVRDMAGASLKKIDPAAAAKQGVK